MFAEERQEEIIRLMIETPSMKVSELSKRLNISSVTIRRDLDELHRQNRILRTHGGAVLPSSVGKALPSSEHVGRNIEQKRSIAQVALQQINNDDTLMLDSSSSVFEVVKLLCGSQLKNIRVVTTSILVVQTLSGCPSIKVMLIGGDWNSLYNTVEGFLACRQIAGLRVDKCFIGINGIDESFGFSTPRPEDAGIKACMIEAAAKTFTLADSTKFGQVFLAKVQACNCLISDARIKNFNYEAIDGRPRMIFADEFLRGKKNER